ncbi:acetyl-CoA sensor PanZ family protein [Pseudomonas sp. JS3066]|jgi:GNAT superfamily N-acetyltransferase|uniref:acetyl-CoA sensor PanZ family protein n=1 Tax=unclassified Pseudomonas TaxID=196821 RepID=UPI000EA97349|nr:MULTISPECIES: acetyl-CoA sensor PanZ family protein [unclassified Pseudomonas]AYF89617.1 GNAT family N-acetyltransferase [Pseudomonas sp. DY-1]MDH4656165.1 PanM family protein [Pseudomonas sp. BN606]MRK21226.1 PanM family protein [Pseudomonas sp. JG-B]WVK92820.1 acetyl-CoA sensor PanZ family protein [Pseudomonas sp. JS3066]
MPVIVETPNSPSEQDRGDLAKIYADAPDWLLAPYASAAELVTCGEADGLLFTGRFNDRLLGAALLERGETHWRLSHLCVRKVTRHRGVGRRIVEEAVRLARESGKSLHLAAPLDHLECQALAAHLHLPLESL